MKRERPDPAESTDVWLRGNIRPSLAAAAATMLSGVLILSLLVAFTSPRWLIIGVSAVLAAGGAATAALVIESARPRVAREGGSLLLRLAPWHLERVPLGAVECFFLGSSPVGTHPATSSCDGAGATDAEKTPPDARRRGTLAIRLAERATEYAARSVSLPWGGWARGTIVVDGLWCEPLTPNLVREMTGKLVAAKRETA
jgi:hypothetical protein